MESELILQTNIFFYITSVAVVLVTVMVIVVLYYVLKIVRTIAEITDTVRKGVRSVSDGVDTVKKMVEEGESKIMPIMSFVAHQAERFGSGAKPKRAKRTKREDDESA